MKDSKYKHIQRLFRTFPLDFSTVARFIVSQLPESQYLLTLGRTNWKFGQTHINILCLAIIQQGVAIPVLSILPDKTGNSNTDERIPHASRVTAILGDYKWRWEIETFFKTLKSQGSDFEATYLTGLDRIEKLLLGASPRGMVTRAKTDPNQESSPSGHQYFQVWFGLAERDFIQYNGKT